MIEDRRWMMSLALAFRLRLKVEKMDIVASKRLPKHILLGIVASKRLPKHILLGIVGGIRLVKLTDKPLAIG